MGTLWEALCTFILIPQWILQRMRNVSDKSCRENENTHFSFNNFFFFKLCHLWDNVEKYGTARQAAHDVMWCICFACLITKATDTHSEYVIPIVFRQQQWVLEKASMLRCTYAAYLVKALWCILWSKSCISLKDAVY